MKGTPYTGSPAPAPHLRPHAAAGLVFALSFLFYLATLAPTVIWGDSAEFAIHAKRLHLDISADSHPLFVILGRLFSFLPFEPAYSLNLLTAVTASLAVSMVYLVVFELTGSVAASIAGASSLAVSHAFWLHAVITEVYDLNAFFITAIVLVLLKWRRMPEKHSLLYAAAFLFGLGLANHLIMALSIVGFFVFIALTDRRVLLSIRTAGFTILSFLIGNALMIHLLIGKLIAGRQAAAVANAAAGGAHKKAMFTVSLKVFHDFLMYLAYLFYQFPLAGIALGAFGITAVFRKNRDAGLLLSLLILINMAFFLTFGPGAARTTKYTFYIPDYAVFSIFIGCGFAALADYFRRKGYPGKPVCAVMLFLIVALPIFLYSVAPYASKKLSVDLLHARSIPYRDNEEFFLYPGKRGYTGAVRYADEALKTAGPGAIIIADHTLFTVLRYCQEIRGMGNDVKVLPSGSFAKRTPETTVAGNYGTRDIYLASMEKYYYRVRELRDEYDFVPVGVLFKVVKKPGKA
ncbi:MAG: DUF2723 domain-containing protein [Deltaproteobacteria bacterium]|nr:DUF2723 domain-containing protein [Deltaproteobacteria bacterium]